MTMTDNQIQLTDIDESLKYLWDQNQGENKIRASLFNLILYVQKNERSESYKQLIKSVVSKFPCRVIMIFDDCHPNEKYLRTKVGSETVGGENSQVYCEIIEIETAGQLTSRVPFLVLPHLIPDLPIYLLWAQDPSKENIVLPYLEPIARRIIVDSSLSFSLQSFCRNVISLTKRFHCEIGDIKWAALSGWRSLFAQSFADADAFYSLAQSKTIRIYYNQKIPLQNQNPLVEAAYFQAWLSSRLNWKFFSIENNEGNIRLTYKRPLNEIVILLIPQEVSDLTQGTLLGVEIESQKKKGLFSFKRHQKTRQIFMQFSDKESCCLPVVYNLSGAKEGEEIIDEIFYPSGKEHYREMLETLALIQWRF